MLTREDGLQYIGITTDIDKRIYQHKKSIRFSEHALKSYEILFEGSYSDCEDKESLFIEQYDTFNNGLNETSDGKGKSKTTKFNTLGKKYSEESKRKMSENNWLKNTPPELRPNRKGILLRKTEKRLADIERRKNKETNPSCKRKTDTIREIQELFSKFIITKDIALKYCKKSQKEPIECGVIIDFTQCVGKGGHPFNITQIFSHEISPIYNCSSVWIRKLLNVKL